MAQALVSHVFMSYSRKDEEVMRRITTFLRQEGIRVWVDNEKLIPGTPIWEAEIEKAIIGAAAIVVLLSPDAKDSIWVRRELGFTEQYRKRIFPVLVRGNVDSSIPLRLITNQYIDIQKNESLALKSLSTALHPYLEQPESEERKAQGDVEKLRQWEALELGTQNELGQRKKILLIDDEPAVHESARRILGDTVELGEPITAVKSREMLFRELTQQNPDGIILDLDIHPGGTQIYKWIREWNENIPIVFYTRHADTGKKIQEMLDVGATFEDIFIKKESVRDFHDILNRFKKSWTQQDN
jgi:CheY-like chemotaxis protein